MIWILRMAWRDSRASRRKLLLYASAIVLGIAALVAIAGFGQNLEQAIQQQSKSLLAADLVLTSRTGFSDELEQLVAAWPARRATEVSFASMILHPESGMSRLVSIRAVDGAFPLYGTVETEPTAAAAHYLKENSLLVEENLMLQFGARPGEMLRVGELELSIAGALRRVPGESPGFSLLAPRVYLPFSLVEDTGLVQRGSRVLHRWYFAFDEEGAAALALRENRELFRNLDISVETLATRQQSLGRSFANLNAFLGLVGFVALLLGGVGVASGIQAHVREKYDSIAVLRCLGATMPKTFGIYLIQAVFLGLAGALAGVMAGLAVQALMPWVLRDILPVEVAFAPSWSSAIHGLVAGVGLTLLFSLLPLLGLRQLSPLRALRASFEAHLPWWRDPLIWTTLLLLVLAVAGFAWLQTGSAIRGMAFTGALLIVVLTLSLVGWILIALAKVIRNQPLPYLWRQGLANLFRPQNRTFLLMLALGLGAFVLVTLQLLQGLLLREVAVVQAENRANMILFDIQSDQLDELSLLLSDRDHPVLDTAPIISMRLSRLQGEDVRVLRDNNRFPRWVLTREYRATYREFLSDTERITAGRWIGRVDPQTEVIPISLEEEIAGELGVTVGDRIVFDVQGVPLETEVASLRAVDWRRVQSNFFVVFPTGVLEDAPQFLILMTRVENPAESAALQNALVQSFPNVSAIDLNLLIETIDSILGQVAYVLRFMALFSVGTGLLVLFAVVFTGRFQRVRESALLRTLGGRSRQIQYIQLVEYGVLGTLASLTGLLLAWCATWALGHWVFELRVLPPWLPLVWAWLLISGLTILTGWWTQPRLNRITPLEALREGS